MRFIEYKEKKYKTITIHLSKDSNFNSLLKKFHILHFKDLAHNIEHIRYAVLELVNNSIRAHKEQNTDSLITLLFKIHDEYLEITIKDAGGGFDIRTLPYDINENVDEIELNSLNFQDYREKYDYNRFGMGLLITKRTFDYFRISFYTEEGDDSPWEEGKTIGTIIQMRSNIKK